MGFNPLFWLHFRLTGAWRNNAAIAGVAALLIGGIAAATYRAADPPDYMFVSRGWLAVVTGAQALLVLLLAPGAIRKAVLRDFQTGMIESHRMSPMSATRIVFGYMTGPPVQAAWLMVVMLTAGTLFATHVGQTLSPLVVPGWWAAQGCLLVLGLLLGSVVLLTALSTSGRSNVVGAVVLISLLGGWVAVQFLPGLALLIGFISAIDLLPSLFGAGPTIPISTASVSLVVAVPIQIAFCLIFLRAAVEKVRAPDAAMFSMPLGTVLTGAWGFTLIVGMALVAERARYPDELATPRAQLIASVLSFMVVALFPLVGAASERFRLDRARGFGVRAGRRQVVLTSALPLLLGTAALLVLVGLYRFAEPMLDTRIADGYDDARAVAAALKSPAGLTALGLSLVLWAITDFCWIYRAVARGKRVWITLGLLYVILRMLPLGIELMFLIARETMYESVEFSQMFIGSISPIGTLIWCMNPGGNPWPGLVVQVIVAALSAYVARRAWRRVVAPGSHVIVAA